MERDKFRKAATARKIRTRRAGRPGGAEAADHRRHSRARQNRPEHRTGELLKAPACRAAWRGPYALGADLRFDFTKSL